MTTALQILDVMTLALLAGFAVGVLALLVIALCSTEDMKE
jgi:hypothetical protein